MREEGRERRGEKGGEIIEGRGMTGVEGGTRRRGGDEGLGGGVKGGMRDERIDRRDKERGGGRMSKGKG